jgi:hypothetical protein
MVVEVVYVQGFELTAAINDFIAFLEPRTLNHKV